MQRRFTCLAIFITFALLIPGEMAGWLAASQYRRIIATYLSSDTILDAFTNGWFSKLWLEGSANVMQGAIAGALVSYLCAKVVERADYTMVAYANSALVIALTLIGLAFEAAKTGLDLTHFSMVLTHFSMVANTAGLVAGLFTMAERVSGDQRAVTRASATADVRR